MISVRYHVFSVGAVFLALAVGVLLGTTTISGRLLSGLSDETTSLGKQVSDLSNQRNALNARLSDADSFVATVGPLAVHDALAGHSVVLVTAADVRPADRDALTELLRGAGATVTGELRLTDAFTDPARADQLRELVIRLLPAGVQLPVAADPGTLAGGLLRALLLLPTNRDTPPASAAETTAALSGLVSGGFLRAGPEPRPAQLAVVLTGTPPADDSAADRAATMARFATELRRSTTGAVLAGGAGSADGSGPIGVVRADTAAASVLSTVDDADTSAGRVATVLALREQLGGRAGRYGVAGNAQAPAPAPRPNAG